MKNHDFTQKKSYFFSILGGEARQVRSPLPTRSALDICINIINLCNQELVAYFVHRVENTADMLYTSDLILKLYIFIPMRIISLTTDKMVSGLARTKGTKTGRHDIAEILLKMALNTKNQSIRFCLTAYCYQVIIIHPVNKNTCTCD